MLEIKLKRNLRKKLKQGEPWLYKDALDLSRIKVREASFVKIYDSKGEVCRGVYDPRAALAFRVLDLREWSQEAFSKAVERAFLLRKGLYGEGTDAFRLIAGEGDGLGGLVCDLYDDVAVVQCDGPSMEDFWLSLDIGKALITQIPKVKKVFLKSRKKEKELRLLQGPELESTNVTFKENHVLFESDLAKAQKTGFFLDQRENRQHIKKFTQNKEVWNVFSYTGGFSVYAGLGGAAKVFSVDVAKGALDQAQKNWELNGLEKNDHQGLAVDAFDYLKQKKFFTDMMIVDPPSMTSSLKNKERAVEKYKELFAQAAQKVKGGGDLILSSCSRQVSFDDFKSVVEASLSSAKKKGFVLRFSGQGFDHPYPHACEDLRYLKFIHLKL